MGSHRETLGQQRSGESGTKYSKVQVRRLVTPPWTSSTVELLAPRLPGQPRIDLEDGSRGMARLSIPGLPQRLSCARDRGVFGTRVPEAENRPKKSTSGRIGVMRSGSCAQIRRLGSCSNLGEALRGGANVWVCAWCPSAYAEWDCWGPGGRHENKIWKRLRNSPILQTDSVAPGAMW